MRLNTLEKVLLALETEGPEIDVPIEVQALAKQSLQLMLDWSA